MISNDWGFGLAKIQDDAGRRRHVIPVDGGTRWSSTLHMLNRFYEERDMLANYAAQFPGKITLLDQG